MTWGRMTWGRMTWAWPLCAAAIAAAGAPPARAELLPKPEIKLVQARPAPESGVTQVHLTVSNWQAFAPSLFEPAPALAPCGTSPNGSRSVVEIFNPTGNKRLESFCAFKTPGEMKDIAFAAPTLQRPKFVYVVVTDRKLKRRAKSDVLKLP
jgi:hypothetical protein